MNRLAAAAGAWALSLALIVPAASAADLALVIGNHDYSRAPDALSARADASAVADALEQGGYQVISGTNLNRGEMRRRIADFAGRLDQADRVVVFYSGHAMRSGGQSYLAPVDQGNGSLVEVMMDGVPLDLVLRLAGGASGRAVVFVDGAQLDGFTPRSFAEPGLAHIQPPEGVLVVSAAAPGRAIPRRSTGQSDFARQVVDEFLAPGASVGQAVRRLGSPAWVGGDTDSSLVLVPPGRGPIAGDGTDTETGTGTGGLTDAQVEARLGLTASQRRGIQEHLNLLGYDTRGVDGIFGPGTRTALRNWQRANDLEETGYLTDEQVALIGEQARESGSPPAADTGTSPADPAAAETALELTRTDRLSIEQRLAHLGFSPGPQDGFFDEDTRWAIERYQRSRGYRDSGYLDERTVAGLVEETRGVRTGIVTGAEVLIDILRGLGQ